MTIEQRDWLIDILTTAVREDRILDMRIEVEHAMSDDGCNVVRIPIGRTYTISFRVPFPISSD